MDQACRWVIKYVSFLLGNVVPNDDIIMTSVKMPFIRYSSDSSVALAVVICQLVCRLAVDIFNIILVTHCPYADLLTNLTLKCAN